MKSYSTFSILITILFIAISSYTNAQSITDLEQYNTNENYYTGINYFNTHDSIFSKDKYANYLLGEMGLKSQAWKDAKKGYETAIALCSPSHTMNFHEQLYTNDNFIYWACNDGLGVVYYSLGDKKKALAALEEADKWMGDVNVSQANAVTHYYNLACAYSINDNYEKAVNALKKTLELNPNYISKILNERDFYNMRNYKPFQTLVQ